MVHRPTILWRAKLQSVFTKEKVEFQKQQRTTWKSTWKQLEIPSDIQSTPEHQHTGPPTWKEVQKRVHQNSISSWGQMGSHSRCIRSRCWEVSLEPHENSKAEEDHPQTVLIPKQKDATNTSPSPISLLHVEAEIFSELIKLLFLCKTHKAHRHERQATCWCVKKATKNPGSHPPTKPRYTETNEKQGSWWPPQKNKASKL